MAVYRCEVKTLKRASGRSAVAAVAYRAAERLRDEQTGKVHDYRRRAPGVAYREVMAGRDAPEWGRQRGRLWNEAERAETRKNSVTAREIMLSLPHELDDVQRIDLVRSFADRLIDRYGVAVDVAIHRPDRKGDGRNHHAHLMMTTRRLGREGFTEKTRELDDVKKRGPEEIEAIRELWEREHNLAMERSGRGERVTRKSLAEQGLDREPEPKIGEAANALLRRGEKSSRGEMVQEVRRRNSMRENMRLQRDAKFEARRQETLRRALEAGERALREQGPTVAADIMRDANRQRHAELREQQAREQGLKEAADALMRDTSEERKARRDAEQQKKDEERKRDEERQKHAEISAMRAWEKQRQEELRKQREAKDRDLLNERDPGRVRTPPGPGEKD